MTSGGMTLIGGVSGGWHDIGEMKVDRHTNMKRIQHEWGVESMYEVLVLDE